MSAVGGKADAQQQLGLPDLQVVEAFRTINQGGDDPSCYKDANDREAEICKAVIQPCVYRKPKSEHSGDEARQGSRVT